MVERSVLCLRVRPHFREGREEDIVVEVVREGEVAATIYGSREGLHIVSDRLDQPPFRMDVNNTPSIVVPLLKAGDDACPWCGEGVPLRPCPVCGRPE